MKQTKNSAEVRPPTMSRGPADSFAHTLEESLYADPVPAVLSPLSRASFFTGISRAFDLAEGRRPGHAQRVAFVGLTVAAELKLDAASTEATFFACLLHDLGHALGEFDASTGDWRARLESLAAHSRAGARLARKLGFPEAVAEAVAVHHASWSSPEGTTPPNHTPIAGRIVRLADAFVTFLESHRSVLLARREAAKALSDLAGNEVDPDLADSLASAVKRDDFWLELYDNDLCATLMALNYGGILDQTELLETVGVLSDIVDARNRRRVGSGRSVGQLAFRLAEALGLPEPRARMVRIAALVRDIGTLAIPPQILSKPDILSVGELQAMQLHPVYAQDILSEIPGFGTVSWWVGCHHERVDGKGYPGMLEGSEVPTESQIIGLCEAYVALTSERPYRAAMSPDDALIVLHGQAGARFDHALVEAFAEIAAESRPAI